MTENENDVCRPDLYWYRPASIDDFMIAIAEVRQDEIENGDVPWKAYLDFCKSEIKEFLDDWYSAKLLSGNAELSIKGSKDNGEFLENIRSLVLGLAIYGEIQNYFNWINQQLEKVKRLEEHSIFLRLTARVDEIVSGIKKEVEEVRLESGIEQEIEKLEERLLKFYEKEVSDRCMGRAAANQRSKRQGSPYVGLKPERRKITKPYDYEIYCADWMRYLGARQVEVTVASNDGGIDVTANGIVAQVKFYNKPVGVSDVRNLYGAASAAQARAVFFTSMAYSEKAIHFANENGIVLLIVDNFDGTVVGANPLGSRTIREGL